MTDPNVEATRTMHPVSCFGCDQTPDEAWHIARGVKVFQIVCRQCKLQTESHMALRDAMIEWNANQIKAKKDMREDE